MTFKTPTPAHGSILGGSATVDFDPQGTASSSRDLKMTSGTFKVTSTVDESKSYSGKFTTGSFYTDSN
jgi:hypothetical protein